MNFHYNTTPVEVALWLREQACSRGMAPNFINALDDLIDATDQQKEIDELTEQNGALESAKDDLWLELGNATDALRLASEMLDYISKTPEDTEVDQRELAGIKKALEIAEKALERHDSK